jgi:hypothetical protein
MKLKRRARRDRHKTAKSERRKSSARSNAYRRPPTSAEELFARPKTLQEQWNRVVQVPSEMRAHGLTLAQASRQLGVSTKTVLRQAGSAFTKKKGRYKVKPMDRLLRVMLIPGKKGLREIVLRDSREASLVGQYWSAVDRALSPVADTSAFRNLPRKTVKDEKGKRFRLLTNLGELKRQASAGVLHFESLYGRAA